MRLLFLLFLLPSIAWARNISCGAVETGVIEIDGLLGDWGDVTGMLVERQGEVARGKAWDGPDDLSFVLRCNYDQAHIYVAIDVRDERLVRTRKADRAEDNVEIRIAGRRLVVYPADLRAEIPRVAKWNNKPLPKGIEIAESMQPKGWSVEVSLPWNLVSGYGSGIAQLRGFVAVHDADMKAPLREDATMWTGGGGAFMFGEGEELLQGFLEQIGARRSEITLDKMVDMGGDPGPERVVRVGRTVGILGKDYLYFQLPVRDPREVREFRLLDLAGDGKHAVVARYVESGSGGQREVLAAWKIVGANFRRTFACEVSKQIGNRRLENRYAFVRRGRANDIVVEARPSAGFSAETYKEQAAEDMIPILLPWEGKKRARYRFRADEYFEVQ